MNEQSTAAPMPRSLGKMVVGSILVTAAVRFAEREAFYCSSTGRRLSYRELNLRCNRLANGLLALGLPRGSVVAFLCSNRVEIVEIYFAIAKAGLVGLPLNYRLAPAEATALIDAMGACMLIAEGRFAAIAGHVRATSPGIAHTVWIGTDAPVGAVAYEALLGGSDAAEPDVEVEETDPYYFNLTSGTTGLPKAYLLSQYNSAALGPALITYGVVGSDVFLTVFPAFGRVAFGWIVVSILYGARHVLVNFDPPTVLRLIRDERVTFTMLVPTMAAMLLATPGLDSRELGSLRGVGLAGSMLPPTIRNAVMQRICPHLYEGYGLQESGWLAISTPEDRARQPDSVGRPVVFAETRIVDPAGRDVPAGEIGEIIARSPNCVSGYYHSPAKNAESFRNGWFHTGDLGRFDAQGYLYICGRVKDMIISGGQNIHSAEVEATLLAFPGITECAVIGLPDDTWGERVTAILVAAGTTAIDPKAVQEHCRGQLAGFKIPRELHVRQDALPRTPTGKVQKFLLVEQYRGCR